MREHGDEGGEDLVEVVVDEIAERAGGAVYVRCPDGAGVVVVSPDSTGGPDGGPSPTSSPTTGPASPLHRRPRR